LNVMFALARNVFTWSMGLTASTLVNTCAPPPPESAPPGASSCAKRGTAARTVTNSQIILNILIAIVRRILILIFHALVLFAMEFIVFLALLIVEKHSDFRTTGILNR